MSSFILGIKFQLSELTQSSAEMKKMYFRQFYV